MLRELSIGGILVSSLLPYKAIDVDLRYAVTLKVISERYLDVLQLCSRAEDLGK